MISHVLAVGSANPAKVQAVRDVVRMYPHLAAAPVTALAVPSGVSEQPLGFEEIFQGALNRARTAFERVPKCTMAFGLESGLIAVQGPVTGHLDIGICVVYNGHTHATGVTPAFEIPPRVLSFVKAGENLSQACKLAGLTNKKYIGYQEGIVGILTYGRMTRYDYTRHSIITALISLENPELYSAKDGQP